MNNPNQPSKLNQPNTMSSVLIGTVQWFNVERAIGLSLLFSAFVMAFDPLREGSLMQLVVDQTGMNAIIASSWYLLGGIYLLSKGTSASAAVLLLTLMPMLILTFTAIWVAISSTSPDVYISGSDLARESMIILLILQRLITKIAIELIEYTAGRN